MKKSNLIALVVFVVALVWVFTLDNTTIRNIQSKVLGLFGIAHEMAAEVSFDEDLVNGEPIGPKAIAERYEKEELANRYSQLLQELFTLRAWQLHIDELRDENIDLKRSLNFVDSKRLENQHLIAARVVDRQSGSWWKTIIIDKGIEDGVVEDSPVITPVEVDRTDNVEGALVGKVTNVSQGQSMVVLATDPECRVAARVHGVFAETSTGGLQRVQGILSGSPGAGTKVPHLLLRNLPKEADRYGVKAGAKVYSTGIITEESEGVFPPGLLLGRIKEFEVRDIDAEARVSPALDFNALSYVFVLLPLPEGEMVDPAPKPRPLGTGDTARASPVVPGAAPAPEEAVPRAGVVPGSVPRAGTVPDAVPRAVAPAAEESGVPRAGPVPTDPTEVPRAAEVPSAQPVTPPGGAPDGGDGAGQPPAEIPRARPVGEEDDID